MEKKLKTMLQHAMEAPAPERKQEFLCRIRESMDDRQAGQGSRGGYGRFVAGQVFYIGKWGWCGSFGAFLGALLLGGFSDKNLLWTFSAAFFGGGLFGGGAAVGNVRDGGAGNDCKIFLKEPGSCQDGNHGSGAYAAALPWYCSLLWAGRGALITCRRLSDGALPAYQWGRSVPCEENAGQGMYVCHFGGSGRGGGASLWG